MNMWRLKEVLLFALLQTNVTPIKFHLQLLSTAWWMFFLVESVSAIDKYRLLETQAKNLVLAKLDINSKRMGFADRLKLLSQSVNAQARILWGNLSLEIVYARMDFILTILTNVVMFAILQCLLWTQRHRNVCALMVTSWTSIPKSA